MARRQTLISEIANDARTARLEPTLMKGAATLEPQGVRFKRERVLWGFQGGTSARQPESLGSISADSPQTEKSNLGWRSAGGGLALWLSRGPKIERNVLL
ncbi:hypothetical protein Q8A67_020225 [Cirrhinus molitorella]|uniref:Uncharacterized protein n=1 Tax=Cirrhinus molitorella TaxID=172907 RepID=A0AA88P4W0_9TELE|nr:hypothetical protein Q8A67_020225 [Cirrhinus molitorella]